MPATDYSERRERVFLVLAGVFICIMTILNIVGITRFVQLGPMALAVGVLPYPLTFLCTDLISELYGRSKANFLVTLGLGLNALILLVLYLGQIMPAVPEAVQPPWQHMELAVALKLPNGDLVSGTTELFTLMYGITSGAVVGSMLAYMFAQYCDVQLYHFWRRLTHGKHLWLRNNFSTLLSQGVDSFVVIGVTFGAVFLDGEISALDLLVLMGSNYLFKLVAALLDTGPLYVLVYKLRPYLGLRSNETVADVNARPAEISM